MDGQMICRLSRLNQQVVVVDQGPIRLLHFDSRLVQSRMDLREPGRLLAEYTKRMLVGLAGVNQVKRVLLVGLGGGSLARFFHHHFPSCQVEAVEPNPLVIQVARDYFFPPGWFFPLVHQQDGLTFIKQAPLSLFRDYDLIFVDVFTDTGMAPPVFSTDFFQGCLGRLAAGGVVMVNLGTSNQEDYRQALGVMLHAFGDSLHLLKVVGTGNVIGVAGRTSWSALSRERVYRLQRQLDIPLADYLLDLQPVRQTNLLWRWMQAWKRRTFHGGADS
ncbi:MAG: hypothetical protein G8345_09450 [Magnetococcales bacterium]|nr:hypothetical protein [Magnetococcales bacterium]NGZ27099.1 hypothetical protein [Magnetococcales bacterium]